MAPLKPGRRMIATSALHEAADNPRTIADDRLEQLAANLVADPLHFQARPIIAMPDGEIIAGNMRHRAATARGLKTVPGFIVPADITPAHRREIMVRDNEGFGEWDGDALAQLVAAHDDAGADTSLLGLDDASIDALLESVRVPDFQPEPPPAPGNGLDRTMTQTITCPHCGESVTIQGGEAIAGDGTVD